MGAFGIGVGAGGWPTPASLKGIEAAAFELVQIAAPPPAILVRPHDCFRHAAAAERALSSTGLGCVVHAPPGLMAGSAGADRSFAGLLAYTAEVGGESLIYHAHDIPDEPRSEDRVLAETRSLARLAETAEWLGVTIALENLAPVYPGRDHLSHTPALLRRLILRIGSPALALCLDLGHAHIVADIRRTGIEHLVRPVLDSIAVFEAHDNLGARRGGPWPPELDPLRLDLHLVPGRGTVPWSDLAPLLAGQPAPVILEVNSSLRPDLAPLRHEVGTLLGGAGAGWGADADVTAIATRLRARR